MDLILFYTNFVGRTVLCLLLVFRLLSPGSLFIPLGLECSEYKYKMPSSPLCCLHLKCLFERLSFFFLLRCSYALSDPASSSTESVEKSLESTIVHTIFSKSSINDLKIFSTTRQVGNVFPFPPSWFTIVSTRQIY